MSEAHDGARDGFMRQLSLHETTLSFMRA